MMKLKKVNPLNVFKVRRAEFCPPYFESVTINETYNIIKALDDWIYNNLKGRYYIGKNLILSDTTTTKNAQILNKIKIGFENPSELSYFMLACPLLKYNT